MPTYEASPRFMREWGRLNADERRAFASARRSFIESLRTRDFHPRLRIKRTQSEPRVWEITWAPDGRATFQYGAERRSGEAHIIWRRIGDHSILDQP